LSSSKIDQIREAAEADLTTFIKLIHKGRVLGAIHEEVISWWTREDAKSHQLLLLPRDHMKSALIAYRVAWMLTKNPHYRILYISSTSNLAEKQLGFIKQILTDKTYRMFWPEMTHPEEGKREKWTSTEISVDHPKRKEEAVRDPSIFIAGLTTGITGFHCDIAVLDDVVVRENAHTEDGRGKVRSQYSLLSSIEGTEPQEWVVGTRYHPKDLYNDLQEMEYEVYNEGGEIIATEKLYETMERQVEDMGDGTGEFLWPRQQRYDGRWFGFDVSILSKKKAQYLDRMQFRAQYYNNPNDPDNCAIDRAYFQYYDQKYLSRKDGKWFFQAQRLNVFASIDFAYKLNARADYTSVVVIGVDSDFNYYVLDISRFKTELISEYFAEILRLHQKWDFRKIRAEVTAAQSIIVKDLKENYIRKHGLALSIDEHKPTRHQGSKEERIEAILQPRYANMQMWHYYGGNCQVLEEELVLQNPPHDDVKDALASVVDVSVAPANMQRHSNRNNLRVITNSRFGGIL
jgi:hypothetical protein